MLNLKTGQQFKVDTSTVNLNLQPQPLSRRSALKGLAAILAASSAPALLGQTARGIMHRNLGGRIATMGGGGGAKYTASSYPQGEIYVQFDGIENGGFGIHNTGSGTPTNLAPNPISGTVYRSCTFNDKALSIRNTTLSNNAAFSGGMLNALNDKTFSFCYYGKVNRTVDVRSDIFTLGYRNASQFVYYGGYRASGQGWINVESVSTGLKIADNVYHCVVITSDNENTKIYIDGVLAKTVAHGSITTSGLGSFSVLDFGSNTRNETLEACSAIIYGRTLTDAEAAQVYAINQARFGDLN